LADEQAAGAVHGCHGALVGVGVLEQKAHGQGVVIEEELVHVEIGVGKATPVACKRHAYLLTAPGGRCMWSGKPGTDRTQLIEDRRQSSAGSICLPIVTVTAYPPAKVGTRSWAGCDKRPAIISAVPEPAHVEPHCLR
jgi:hypothetical protein